MAAHEQDDKLHLHLALKTVNIQEGAINTLQLTTKMQKVTIDSLQVAIDSLQAEVKALQVKVDSQYNKLKNEDSRTFRLSEYLKKKEDNEYFEFPPFLTHPRGYYVAHTNGWGSGKGTHVSVHAPILKGEYDVELKWPLLGRVTFTLLNQLEDANHHTRKILLTRPTLDMLVAHGVCVNSSLTLH